jgi:hypothetical protein
MHDDMPVVCTIEIDTLEYQQTEKIETELKDVDTSKQVYAALSRVSFWGIPFTQYHILFLPCRQPPPPPSRKEALRWRVLYRITRQLLHRARCESFSKKIETAS